jgi:hypothetical protein
MKNAKFASFLFLMCATFHFFFCMVVAQQLARNIAALTVIIMEQTALAMIINHSFRGSALQVKTTAINFPWRDLVLNLAKSLELIISLRLSRLDQSSGRMSGFNIQIYTEMELQMQTRPEHYFLLPTRDLSPNSKQRDLEK